VVVIDDYAHHPTEIRATLSAARDRYPGRPIWAVWQPHTYSRTQLLFDEFSTAFEGADHVLVTEVYAARETIPGNFSSRQIVQAMSHPDAEFAASLEEAVDLLSGQVQSGDVVLVLSAGDAEQISVDLLADLADRNTGSSAGSDAGRKAGGSQNLEQNGRNLVR
jgi:UDP-N-acetylmuramate--alanine ligase